jgi:glycosyltransferase involved in cell wall biosynthesis
MDRRVIVAEYIGTILDGGAETLVKDYALLIDKEKFDIKVIVNIRRKNTSNDKILSENNIDIISVYPDFNIIWRVWNKLFGRWYIPYKLNKIITNEKIDVLHIHLDVVKNIKPIYGKLKNIKLFYTCHNEPNSTFKKKGVEDAVRCLIKNNNMQMIALHRDMADKLNRMFGIDNTVIIRNGIDFRRFNNIINTKTEIRADLGIPNNAYVVGHIGRFVTQKNHKFLIKIFAELNKRVDNCFLLMVGKGKLMYETLNELKKLGLKDQYLVLSNRSDIPEIMKAMDVYVFPSLYEGFSISLIEAQVEGLRCIVSDTINNETFLSENTVSVSLNKDPSEWADVVLDNSIKGKIYGDLNDCNLNKEIKRIEKLYMGELL